MYKIEFTEPAINNLEEIYSHIKNEKKRPEAAGKLIARIYNATVRLKQFPMSAHF